MRRFLVLFAIVCIAFGANVFFVIPGNNHVAFAQATTPINPGGTPTTPINKGGTPTNTLPHNTAEPVINPVLNKPVKLSVPLPSAGPKASSITEVQGSMTGNILFDYISYAYRWAAGVIGVVAILMIIISGFMMVFASGNQQVVDEAKSRMMGAILGLALMIVSALLLWTINPGFFGNVYISQTEEPQLIGTASPLQSTAVRARAIEAARTGSVLPRPTKNLDCSAQLKELGISDPKAASGLAWQVNDMNRDGKLVLYPISASVDGSGPLENIASMMRGECPITEHYTTNPPSNCDGSSNGSSDPDQDPAHDTAPYLKNAPKSLQGLIDIANAGMIPEVSALYGNNHNCPEHRELRAFDINYLEHVHVTAGLGVDKLCGLAKAVLRFSNASRLLGPSDMHGECDDSRIVGDTSGGHETHFHVEWGGAVRE